MINGKKIAVVIPMYNPGNLVLRVLEAIPAEVDLVVVVDDGSTDGSPGLVAGFQDPRIRLVAMERNSGVGAATLRGMEAAAALGAEVLVKVDADDQMDPRRVPLLVRPIVCGRADCAKGNRFFHVDELEQMPLVRRVGNMALSFVCKAATGYWDIFDPTNGFLAMHAKVFEMLNKRRIARDYFFEISLLAELGLHRCVVRDVPIPARYPHEVSHLSVWRALFRFPRRLLALLLRRIWLHHFVQDFGMMAVSLVMGTSLCLVGAVFGISHWLRSARLGMVTPTGTVMLAVLPLVFGFQLLLQALYLDIQSVPRVPVHLEVGDEGQGSTEKNASAP